MILCCNLAELEYRGGGKLRWGGFRGCSHC